MSQIASVPQSSTPPEGRLPSFRPAPPPPAWPRARIEALTRAWRQGQSAAQIAAHLGGGLTRCAVIGKLHRLGLCGGRKPSAPQAKAFPDLAPAPRAWARPAPAAIRAIWPELARLAQSAAAAGGPPPSTPGPKYLRDMTRRECRFGLGDPGAGNGAFQLFCAAPTAGHAYCAHHRAIACLAPSSTKEQKANIMDLKVVSDMIPTDRRPIARRSGVAL